MDPAHTLRPRLGARDVQRRQRGIDASYLETEGDQQQRERPRPTADIEHAARAELVGDVQVRVEIRAVTLECVVHRNQSRMLEDFVSHADASRPAGSSRTSRTMTAEPSMTRSRPGVLAAITQRGSRARFLPFRDEALVLK